MKKYEVISKYKMLCSSDKFRLYSRGAQLYILNIKKNEYKKSESLPISNRYKILSKVRIGQRVLRLEPRCGIFINEDEAIVSFHGGIYRIECINGTIILEHHFRKPMNNPLSFCVVNNVDGFNSTVMYGEYFGNKQKEPVKIFERNCDGRWNAVFSFHANEVRHIHNIVTDEIDNCLYILTGDEDKQSGIWKVTDNFRAVKKILFGKQQYRTCVAFPYKKGILYATDTPLEQNSIYFFDTNMLEDSPSLKKICDIAGPCIYGKCLDKNLFAFSTSIEPDSRDTGWKYRLSYKRGLGVKDWYTRIYVGNPEKGFKVALMRKKDFWPMCLFGFGTYQFPSITNGDLIMTGQSVFGHDGKTIRVNLDEGK